MLTGDGVDGDADGDDEGDGDGIASGGGGFNNPTPAIDRRPSYTSPARPARVMDNGARSPRSSQDHLAAAVVERRIRDGAKNMLRALPPESEQREEVVRQLKVATASMKVATAIGEAQAVAEGESPQLYAIPAKGDDGPRNVVRVTPGCVQAQVPPLPPSGNGPPVFRSLTLLRRPDGGPGFSVMRDEMRDVTVVASIDRGADCGLLRIGDVIIAVDGREVGEGNPEVIFESIGATFDVEVVSRHVPSVVRSSDL